MSLIASTSDFDRRVGARVKAARKRAGLSQGHLGRVLGITFQQIQKYEKGTNRIAIGTLHQIASHLRVPITSFIDDQEPGFTELSSELITTESIRLLQAFARITDPKVRARLVILVTTLALPIDNRQPSR